MTAMDISTTVAQGNDEKVQTQGTEDAMKGTPQDQAAYYVQRGDGYDGPYTTEALRPLLIAGKIQVNSLIWKEGMPGWEPYAQVFRAASIPPPLPRTSLELGKDKEKNNQTNLLIDTVSKLDSFVGGAVGLEELKGFSWKKFFSAVLRYHKDEELYSVFHCGSSRTTPKLAEVSADWPTPWIFTRVLVYGILLSLLFGWCAISKGNIHSYPALIMAVSLTVPFTVLILFFEINIRRDISMYNVMRAFVGGGAVSLVITLMLYIFLPDFMAYGGPWWAGPVEETAKLMAVLVVFALARMRVNHILQGILLGGAVGAGFAAFETAGYVFDYFLNNSNIQYGRFGNEALISIALQRGVLAPFCHVVWTAISAGALCRAFLIRRSERGSDAQEGFDGGVFFDKRFLHLFLIPVILHFAWNGSGTFWVKLGLRGDLHTIVYYSTFAMLGVVAWIVALRLIQEGISDVQRAKISDQKASQATSSDRMWNADSASSAARV